MSDPTATTRSDDAGPRPQVPDFELIRPIGRGGFGQVWLAANRTTGQLRAVKVIPLRPAGRAGSAAEPRSAAGREIHSLTRLEANLGRRHANLMAIHHVGKTEQFLFYVMTAADDVSGEAVSREPSYRPATLESRLEAGPLAADECVRLARQLLAGLASLHEAGMVHRDVKPSNCPFVDGELKLADFGLVTEASPLVSRLGTQKYMPPDGRMDMRADVFAAGLVIYEMISGLTVEGFPRLGKRADEVAADPSLSALVRLVLRACQPERNERFEDARAMLAELDSPPERAAGRKAWRLAVALACLAAVASFALWPVEPEPEPVHVNFVTEAPFFEAAIYLDDQLQTKPDGTPCATPCTIENLPPRVHEVVFKRDGLPDLAAGKIDFAQTRQITASWEQ